MTVRRRLAVTLSTIVAIGVIFASYAIYRAHRENFYPPWWQVRQSDSGDYRILAEHFWGIPVDTSTYIDYFATDWGQYIQRVPFREIGVGTLYVAARGMARFFAPTEFNVNEAAKAFYVFLVKAFLAGGMFFFFARVRKAFGIVAGLLALACLFAPSQWSVTDDFMTEPLLRAVYLCMAGVACGMDPEKPQRTIIPLLGLFVLAVFFRGQWQSGLFLFLPVLFYQYREAHLKTSAIAVTALLVAAVPLSILAVHIIGWGNYQLTPGVGLHVNVKTDGATLKKYCAEANPAAAICNSHLRVVNWWNIYLGPKATAAELADFDRFAQREMLTFANAKSAILAGLRHGTNFPLYVRDHQNVLSAFLRLTDMLCWIVLAMGLLHDRLRTLSAIGLLLWLVPMAGYLFAFHDTRHQRPTAGVVLAIAATVAIGFVIDYRASQRTHKQHPQHG